MPRASSYQIRINAPRRLLRLCDLLQMRPEDLVRAFIADLCSLGPRGSLHQLEPGHYDTELEGEGFHTNGSDERDRAKAYVQRAFLGHILGRKLTRLEYEAAVGILGVNEGHYDLDVEEARA